MNIDDALKTWTMKDFEDEGLPEHLGYNTRLEVVRATPCTRGLLWPSPLDLISLSGLSNPCPRTPQYYGHASSLEYLPNVRTPLLVLVSEDDPFLGEASSPQGERLGRWSATTSRLPHKVCFQTSSARETRLRCWRQHGEGATWPSFRASGRWARRTWVRARGRGKELDSLYLFSKHTQCLTTHADDAVMQFLDAAWRYYPSATKDDSAPRDSGGSVADSMHDLEGTANPPRSRL